MSQTVSQWVSADIQIAEPWREIAMDFSMSLGGLGIVEKDDVFQVSYPMSDGIQLTLDQLKVFIQDLDPQAQILHHTVDRENWNKNWQAFFKPTEISSTTIILPEWENPADFDHPIITRIRPAMAFGTGTHETTQLCLEILEKSVEQGMRVLDIGTGSGILGITALHLGAASVDAIENDPFTEENIRDNLKLNGISKGFHLQISESPSLGPAYDLMVINIIKAKLFPLLPGFFETVRPGGQVIVSGLLGTEDKETRALLQQSPWKITKSFTKNEWIAYLCEVQ